MTDLRKAAEQAIEAIMHGGVKEQAAAVYELRQALNVDAVNISAKCVDETAKHEHEPVEYTGNGTAGREADVRPAGYFFKMNDMVNHPPHYKSGGIETIDFIEAKELPYHLGNVVKYISRAGIKSHCPIEDLRKAQWYLNRYVQLMEKTN